MSDLDKEKLVKLLNLTRSNHDSEALGAIRRSNDMLDRANLTWDHVIEQAEARSVSKPDERPEPDLEPTVGKWPPAQNNEPIFTRQALDAKAKARRRIRSVPLFLRVLFFPIWLSLEAYVQASLGERWPMQLVTLTAPLAIAAISTTAWIYLVINLSRRFGVNL